MTISDASPGFRPSLAAVLLTLVLAALATATFGSRPLHAQVQTSELHSFRIDTVATGLENPWSVAFVPGGDILITERPGRLRIIRGGTLDSAPVEGVPAVVARGQGGLLDVVLHPGFASNRLVYLSFSKPGEQGATTAVVRGRLEGNRLEAVEEIFEADAWSQGGGHFGSRMLFDREGKLFVTVGERQNMANAQNLANHAGKILRLNDDGTVPTDNPFVGTPGARPEIYAYGIRSPQGLTLHPTTGAVWESEHGPRGGDEVNLIQPGRNYGWPIITYGINYNGSPITDITAREGLEQPLHYWVPSIATSGLTFYDGTAFPQWRGSIFAGGLAGMHLARIAFDGTRVTGTEKLLEGLQSRIRDVRHGPDGLLYVLLDAPTGALLRLRPAT